MQSLDYRIVLVSRSVYVRNLQILFSRIWYYQDPTTNYLFSKQVLGTISTLRCTRYYNKIVTKDFDTQKIHHMQLEI